MKARKKSVTRDLLRVFEIALFFAISVLGYGMLAKTSASGSKSKSRSQFSDTRNSFIPERFDRSLTERRVPDAAPANTMLTDRQRNPHDVISSLTSIIHLELADLQLLPSDHDSGRAHRIASHAHRRPFNLLQQNPVLLV